MGRINILDSNIYNKISAGEVVERPSSVVKELVENSLDGGATIIRIDISNGGLKTICVTDNGIGMDNDDITKAFLAHSTSKLNQANDLFSISTLGFRGEALASIASVAMVTAKSRLKDSDSGNLITIRGGEVIENMPCGMAYGTVMKIENLFFNTPARLKFMKTPNSEKREITTLIANMIVANPEIAISLFVEGKITMSSKGNGLAGAVQSVYDETFFDSLLPISYSNNNYRINGYIGKKSFSKSNRSYQTIIVNGRVVKNDTIATAVAKAYSGYMMTRCYPVFVLDIIIPFDSVDVNVHPTKAEIRLRDKNKMFGIIYNLISKELTEQDSFILTHKETDSIENRESVKNINNTVDETKGNIYVNKDSNIYTLPPRISINSTNRNTSISGKRAGNMQLSDDIIPSSLRSFQPIIKEVEKKETHQLEINQLNKEYKIVGQLFSTYIIIEYGKDMLLIDQHAAMEKLNYDKLMSNTDKNNLSQILLIPYIFKVNDYEAEFIDNNLDSFSKIHIDIERFRENSYRVSAVPAIISNIDLDSFFKDIFSELRQFNSIKLSELMREILATKACKASIKGGDKLDNISISLLLEQITEDKIPLQCPHGRPAIIRITNNELEKWFRRKI